MTKTNPSEPVSINTTRIMSVRSNLADGIAHELKCSVCLEEFKKPKLLRCYHSFCEECVKELLKKAEDKVIKCPQCRTNMEIPNGDVKSLKSNFFLNNILELVEKNRKRKEKAGQNAGRSSKHLFVPVPDCRCNKKTVAKCQSCNVPMCETCIDNHLQNPETKDHEFVYDKQDLCSEHLFEENKFFCQKCEEMCCVKCRELFHQGHDSINIHKVLKTQKKLIDWLLVKCKSKIPKVDSEMARFTVMEEMTQKHAEDTKVAIDGYFEELVKALRQKSQELKEDVDTLKAEKLKQIYYEKGNVTMIAESFQSGIEFTEQVTKAGNEKEFLAMRKQIYSRLEELSEIEIPKTNFDGRWNLYIDPPYDVNLPLKSSPLVEGFKIKKGAVKSDLTMVGGEEGMMYTTFVNQTCKFVITLKDERGFKTRMQRPKVRVAIRIPSDVAQKTSTYYQDIDVTDNSDGTYCFSYKPKVQGLYYLRITTNGRPLEDDHEWTVDAPLGFGNNSKKQGTIQMYPSSGTGPAWSHSKYSWKIRRVYHNSNTVVHVGVMMDLTSNKWGWCNGRRIEPRDFFCIDENPLSTIPSWLKEEEWTFFNNEETGTFIIFNEVTGKSEVFQRCPGTAARPYIDPPSSVVFSMESRESYKKPIKIPQNSNEIPQTSNEIPQNSNEIPQNSNEIPQSSNEIPENSNEIPENSNEISQNSNEIQQNSNEIPENSNEIPQNSNEIQQNSNEIPENSTEIPENSNGIEQNSNEIPQNSNEIPENSNEIPENSNETLQNSNEIPQNSQQENDHEEPHNSTDPKIKDRLEETNVELKET